MKIAIIIPTYNRAQYLKECLNSLTPQLCGDDHIYLIYNGDKSTQVTSSKQCTVFSCDKTTPAQARNICVSKIEDHYDYYWFLDDDTIVPAGTLNRYKVLLKEYTPDIAGGPDQTPPNSSFFQRTLGQCLASPLCMGPTFRRHKITDHSPHKGDENCLILANLMVKRSFMENHKLNFDPNFFRNEENLFINMARDLKASIWNYPHCYVFHQRRKNLAQALSAIASSGLHRSRQITIEGFKYNTFFYLALIFIPVQFVILAISPLTFLCAQLFYLFVVILFGLSHHTKIHALPMYYFIHLSILYSYSANLLKGYIDSKTSLSK